ncbi:MAG: YdeI/OmpD-associated family protein [Candidatus Limnocylindria bacterium]
MQRAPKATLFATAADFRRWLEANHDTATELWVGYYKKGVGKTSMIYREAVEEALCFGWIDGQARSLDSERYANRYTPRRPTSNWSAINIAKVAELTAAGRMHPAGMRAFEQRDRRKDATYAYEVTPRELPPEWQARLRANADAWAYWQSQPPSYRRTASYWVLSAKRPETRERRMETLIADSAAGRMPRPFAVGRSEPDRT